MRDFKIAFLLIVSILFCGKIHSQENVEDTTDVFRNNQRANILNGIKLGDTLSIKKSLDSLLSLDSKQSIGLLPTEELAIMFYLGEYSEIVVAFQMFDAEHVKPMFRSGYYYSDSLSINLKLNLIAEQSKIREDIKLYISNQEMQDLLDLILDKLLFDFNHPVSYQDSLNNSIKTFKDQYPASEYNVYNEELIFKEYQLNKFAFSLDFAIGLGSFNNSLRNSFGQNGGGSIGLDLLYGNILGSYRFSGGSASVDEAFYVDNVEWDKGIALDLSSNEFSIGYQVLDHKILNLIPYFGVSRFKFRPADKEIQQNSFLDDSRIITYACNFGVNLDLKYRTRKFDSYYGRLNRNYRMIRLRYGVAIPAGSYGAQIGNISYISLGLGIKYRGVH